MTVRQTSREAYMILIENGGLSSDRLRAIYDVIYKKGPMTDGELTKIMTDNYLKSGKDSNKSRILSRNSHRRRKDLVDIGLVYEIGKRKCSITGRTCLLWDVNGNTQVQKITTKKDNKNLFVAKLKNHQKKYKCQGELPNDKVYKMLDIIIKNIEEIL